MNTEGLFTHILQAEHPSTSCPVLPSLAHVVPSTNDTGFVHFFQELNYVKFCTL